MSIGRRAQELHRALAVSAPRSVTPGDFEGLPAPIERWLRRVAPPGSPKVVSVRLGIRGRMRPKPGARALDVTADETLAARIGFAWDARTGIGPIRMRMLDAYHRGAGSMSGRLLGVIPFLDADGPDITRSSRGRLAAESVFVPTSLFPGEGLRWENLDDEQARACFEIDGEPFSPILRVSADGRPTEIRMERWGDVGRDGYGPTPYGFAIEGEQTFDGIRLPARFRGGWWYGTERFDPEAASEFEVLHARFP